MKARDSMWNIKQKYSKQQQELKSFRGQNLVEFADLVKKNPDEVICQHVADIQMSIDLRQLTREIYGLRS